VDKKAWDSLAKRCCNFALDEALCAAYASKNFSDSENSVQHNSPVETVGIKRK